MVSIMQNDNWHAEFNPKKFLHQVNLAQLIERNEIFNDVKENDLRSPCILCSGNSGCGIVLNDKAFLCQNCYSEVSMISYPENYEEQRRYFVLQKEARRLGWEEFRGKCERKTDESGLIFLGLTSLLLIFVNSGFLILTAALLAIGYAKNKSNKEAVAEWICKKNIWEKMNPPVNEPVLRHFHDPEAVLTSKDKKILRVFNHWPGYPPFWSYLRTVVIGRDHNLCQVTGCPSRLGLHVHHIDAVAEGGAHTPENLVSLCDFHHALEPEKGHERIWGDIKTRYFTLVSGHVRSNRADGGEHFVKEHLRRLQLISLADLKGITEKYGFSCPTCGEPKLQFTLFSGTNVVRVECPNCEKSVELPQLLSEETGPMLAEILAVSKNKGRWIARWDMLDERKTATWGSWSGRTISGKRKAHRARLKTYESAPSCPKCGSPMKLVRPQPSDRWSAFWGCTQYSVTKCKGSAKYKGGSL